MSSHTNSVLPVKLELKNIKTLSISEKHCLAISTDGDVFAWGDNTCGQLGIPDIPFASEPTHITKLKKFKVVSISAGGYHSACITSNQNLFIWGDNKHCQHFTALSDQFTKHTSFSLLQKSSKISILEIACGIDYTLVSLDDNSAIRSNPLEPIYIHIHKPITSISACYFACFFLTDDKQLLSFRFNKVEPGRHYKAEHMLDRVEWLNHSHTAASIGRFGRVCFIREDEAYWPPFACVKSAGCHRHTNFIIAGGNRALMNKEEKLDSLFRIAEEKAVETIVRYKVEH